MAKQNLSAVISIGATVMGSVVQSFNVVDKRLGTVTKEIGEVVRKQKEMEKQRTVLEKEGRSVDELDREYQSLGQTLENLQRRRDGIRDISDRIGRVGMAFSGVTRTIAWQAGVAGAAVTGLYTTMAALSVKVAGNIEETNRWAKRIGVTPEMFSKVAYAVKPFGVELDDLADGWKELTLRADEFAKTGKGSGEESFQRLGLTPAQVKQLQKDPAALWAEIQKRASKIVDPSALQRIADELYGGTAAEKIIEYLKLTQDQIRAKDAEADRAGVTVTEEMAERARKFTQEQGRLISVMEGSIRTVAVELMPVISDQFERSSAWLIENRSKVQDFADKLGSTADRIGPVVGEIFTGATKVISVVGDIVVVAKDVVGGWENLGTAATALFVAPTLVSIGKLGYSLIGLVAGTGPVGLVVAGAAAAAIAIIANWDSIKDGAIAAWGGIKSFVGDFWDALKTDASTAYDFISEKAEWMAEHGLLGPIGLVVAHWDLVKSAGENAFKSIETIARPFIDFIVGKTQWISDTWGKVGELWNSFENWSVGDDNPKPATSGPRAPMSQRGVRPPIQARARGGSYQPGLLLTGEHGPELRFETRSGYIATNNQLRDLMRTIGEAGGRLRAISAAVFVGATAAAANPVAQWPNSPVAENQQANTSAPVTSIYTPVGHTADMGPSRGYFVEPAQSFNLRSGGLFRNVPAPTDDAPHAGRGTVLPPTQEQNRIGATQMRVLAVPQFGERTQAYPTDRIVDQGAGRLVPTTVGNAYRAPEPVPPAAPIALPTPQVAMARAVERGGADKVNMQPAAAPNIGPFNFTIHATPGMDVHQIAREVMDQIQSGLRGALYDRGIS